jgi:hypothetical protein
MCFLSVIWFSPWTCNVSTWFLCFSPLLTFYSACRVSFSLVVCWLAAWSGCLYVLIIHVYLIFYESFCLQFLSLLLVTGFLFCWFFIFSVFTRFSCISYLQGQLLVLLTWLHYPCILSFSFVVDFILRSLILVSFVSSFLTFLFCSAVSILLLFFVSFHFQVFYFMRFSWISLLFYLFSEFYLQFL